jgi:hypothetical protein
MTAPISCKVGPSPWGHMSSTWLLDGMEAKQPQSVSGMSDAAVTPHKRIMTGMITAIRMSGTFAVVYYRNQCACFYNSTTREYCL